MTPHFTIRHRRVSPGLRWLGCVLIACFGQQAMASEGAASSNGIDWAQERQFWAFQAPQRQPRPAVKNTGWPSQPFDAFILARLEEAGLKPSPSAAAPTLLRRATLDLTGLPPTPEDTKAFLGDSSPGAYERLVDRLLASPRFGERMASMWLPLARYAEDQAHQVGNDTKHFYPNAWRYRAWVINAFNRDLPYDEFIRLQLAADMIKDAPETDLAALGFLGLGHKYYSRGRLEVQADEWEDRVDTVSRATLGLTVACARCHDHKFEPITMRDYYALAGVFASTQMVNLKPDGKTESDKTTADKMDPGTLHVVQDGDVKNLNIFLRGDVEQKGPEVPRGFLQVLSRKEPRAFNEGSGRRELADAIVSPENPLTARVMVNRVWALFFGRPLAGTPSNLGHSGQRPTHPKLLDDLAARFMAEGWSMKKLVREIVTSSTYQQDSTPAKPGTVSPDPANELLGRMNRKRLGIESWRDSILAVSGRLVEAGRVSIELSDPANQHRTVYARVSRLELDHLLMQYDYPDANVHAEKRALTVTPTQKLFALNSAFMLKQAKALAARLSSLGETDEARVIEAHRLLFAREPVREEVQLALAFLMKPTEAGLTRWEQYAQMLLASNEMLYVD